MADEFLESDVVFSDHRHNPPCAARGHGSFDDHDLAEDAVPAPQRNSLAVRCGKSTKSRGSAKAVANSLPVNIPESMFRRSGSDELPEDDEGMVPPHVIVERRIAGKMAFSVCTGNGRTLKGRDLSQVRNSILRMTGFLEA